MVISILKKVYSIFFPFLFFSLILTFSILLQYALVLPTGLKSQDLKTKCSQRKRHKNLWKNVIKVFESIRLSLISSLSGQKNIFSMSQFWKFCMPFLLVEGFFQLKDGEGSSSLGLFRGMRSLKPQGEDFWGGPTRISRVRGKNTRQEVTRKKNELVDATV